MDILITTLYSVETLKDFKRFVLEDAETTAAIQSLKERVIKFSSAFSMPGYDDH